MPKRPEPCANGPSRSPSLSLSVGVKSSSMTIVPLLVMSPVRLMLARMPVALLAPLMAIAPSFFTLLFELIVTAAPDVGLTEPVELMRISPDAPVVWGVVTAVLITVSALAGAFITAAIAPRPVETRRKRIRFKPLLERTKPPF